MKWLPRRPWLVATGTLLAAAGPVLVGGAVGRTLLDSMNDADPTVLAALREHADPEVAPAAVPTSLPAAGSAPDRLVVAVLDGLGEAGFAAALEHAGVTDWHFRATVDMGTPSLSRPVYHVLLTGVPQAVSGIGNNTHTGRARADDLATRVREAGGTVGWALQGVPWFHDLFGDPGDPYENAWPRRPESPSAIDRFRPMAGVLARTPTFAVLHFVDIDHAGHSHGAASADYLRAAEAAMKAVVALRAEHAKTPAGARTVWMIGADHGHLARGGHGGPEPEVVRTTWLGLWPSPPPTAAAPNGGQPPTDSPPPAPHDPAAPPPRVEIPGIVPADRLAATFAAILGVAPPRTALGDPLPLPGRPETASPPREARRTAVAQTSSLARDSAHRSASTRAALLGAVFAIALLFRGRRHLRATSASVLPSLFACASFWFLGPGRTLSAIATHEGFLLRSTSVLAAGAALGFLVARTLLLPRNQRAPLAAMFLTSALVPAATFAIAAGSAGRAHLPAEALLLFPAAGLVPAGVVAGVLTATALATLFRDRRRTSETGRWGVW